MNAVGIPVLIIDKLDIPKNLLKNLLKNSLITAPIHYYSTGSGTGSGEGGSGTGLVQVELSYIPPTLFFASA